MNADERIAPEHMRFCREPTCRRPIVFALTPAGKTCPIDVVPAHDPKLQRYYLAAWQVERVNDALPHYLLGPKEEAEPDDALFSSHFATCAQPSQFSTKGKK